MCFSLLRVPQGPMGLQHTLGIMGNGHRTLVSLFGTNIQPLFHELESYKLTANEADRAEFAMRSCMTKLSSKIVLLFGQRLEHGNVIELPR